VPRYVTRSIKRTAKNNPDHNRLLKVAKIIIAQVEDLTDKEVMLYKTAFLVAFPAKKVCGIPILYTYKAAINDPQYKGE
jgi:hypothetical protein